MKKKNPNSLVSRANDLNQYVNPNQIIHSQSKLSNYTQNSLNPEEILITKHQVKKKLKKYLTNNKNLLLNQHSHSEELDQEFQIPVSHVKYLRKKLIKSILKEDINLLVRIFVESGLRATQLIELRIKKLLNILKANMLSRCQKIKPFNITI
jgi:protein subunit release factor A